jgi:hypothetical protein
MPSAPVNVMPSAPVNVIPLDLINVRPANSGLAVITIRIIMVIALFIGCSFESNKNG